MGLRRLVITLSGYEELEEKVMLLLVLKILWFGQSLNEKTEALMSGMLSLDQNYEFKSW